MIRRISLMGGPGCGKSTLAARIFSDLKVDGYKVEHIAEYVKAWAYSDRKPKSYDQLYIFGKQIHAEDSILQHVPLIVTDSPIMLNAAYSNYYNFRPVQHLINLALEFETDFPSLNLFVARTVEYQEHGRYQNYEKALEFDEYLLNFMCSHFKNEVHKVQVDDYENIIKLIKENIDGPIA